ncbi:uncharacterized protein BJX67DRAFT_376136 [Aspergillus lucknowensis]|uniref:Uncharacterized protein n=1 Tax=Aspergillus lucknowensis TaxID=176173 RepID=A0ABR4M6S2_9EURO
MDVPEHLQLERGIRISNTPKVLGNATADVVRFLILGTLRYGMIPLKAVRNHQWEDDTPIGRDPGAIFLKNGDGGKSGGIWAYHKAFVVYLGSATHLHAKRQLSE